MTDIILHHYETSPYSEKVRLVRFLQNNIESNQSKPNMKRAVEDWTEDLAWG